ncbi:molybdopterin synthase [Halovivax gelatinilyticus]|uniref:molybdopterin synthase n=1 Tax=Halovivax gelatinilyticus TaxID=2961597 RepID=UPI0020CA3DD5|nr:molybdopterin synthase [Halovivax gelatinilyticus]
MHVLAITDCGASEDALAGTVDRLVDRLGREGRVGVVHYDATIADGTASVPDRVPSGGDVTYELGADGDWAATGTGLSVIETLDTLATTCAYAVVVGVDSLRFPTVAVGSAQEAEPDESVIATVEKPTEVDVEDVFERVSASEAHVTLQSLVDRVTARPEAELAGAVATFTGRVREKDGPDDAPTEYLEFESYEGVADERMAAIRTDLEAREDVHAVALHHRTGVVRNGEDIVFVVVLAGHRDGAFRAVEDGINRLKDEVPLFKKEVTVDDEFWVHDRS